jgi:N-acetylneuraminic acid mutarotase
MDGNLMHLNRSFNIDLKIGKILFILVVLVATSCSNDDDESSKLIITSFAPSRATKDTEVVIQGDNFSPTKGNNSVQIGSTALTVIDASQKTVKVKIPSGIVPGNYNIKITVAAQQVVSTSQIEIVSPGITNVNPIHGTWGNTVTISGENFGNSINDNVVKFGDIEATVVSASTNEVKVLVPNTLLKKSSILSVKAVTTDNQLTSYSAPFTLDAPIITSFSPIAGKSKSEVTIYGENFNPIPNNHVVSFGDHIVEVLSSTSNQLVVKLPVVVNEGDVSIRIDVAEQFCLSNQLFHFRSSWKRLADFPGGNTGDATGFAVGNQGYLGMGYETSKSVIKSIWKFDPPTNSWTKAAAFYFPNQGTTAPFVNMISFYDETYAYVGLGSQGGWPQGPEGKMRKYDPASNSWADITGIGNDPTLYATDGAVSYSVNGKGYVTTGRESSDPNPFPYNGQTSTKMWEYNPTTNIWTRKKDLPSSARWEATGFSINSKLYVLGGTPCRNCVGTNILNDFWEYDALTDTWTQLPDFPGGKRWMATGFSLNGVGYILGGSTGSGDAYNLLNDFWMFEQSTNTWTKLADFPGGKRSAAAVFILNGKAYIGTGLKEDVGYVNDFWEFDPN